MQKSKKVYALYLSVAFFFSLFSFGKVSAVIVPVQFTPEIKTSPDRICVPTGTYTGLDLNTGTNAYDWSYYTTTMGNSLPFTALTYQDLAPYTTTFIANELGGSGSLSGGGNGITTSEVCVNLDNMTAGTYAAGGTGYFIISYYDATETDDPVYGYGYAYYDTGDIFTIPAPDEINYDTHFSVITPTDEATVINPNVTIGATWYVSQEDLDSLDTFISSPANKITVKAFVMDIEATNQASIIKVIDYTLPTGYETSTSTSILFNGTTAGLQYGRNYKLTFQLYGSNYYGLFGNIFNVISTTYFSVGTTTESGIIRQTIASSTAQDLQDNAFANGYSLSACNPLADEWNITDCVLSMFLPDNDFTARKVGEMSATITNAWPIGYITDFVSIVSTTTVGTLTPIDATIPNGIPGAGAHITLSLANVLDPVLNATTSVFVNASAPSTDTFFEITNYYWSIICYILVVLYIIGRVMGSHISGHTGKHETVKTKTT